MCEFWESKLQLRFSSQVLYLPTVLSPQPRRVFLFFIFHFKKPKTKETLWFFSSLKVLRDTDTIWTPFSSIVNQAVKKWQMLTQSRSNSLFQLWPRKAWPFTVPWPLSYSEPLEFWFEPLKRDLQSKALAWEQCCHLPPANCQAEKLFSVLVAASSEYQPRFWTRDRSIWQSQREKPSDSLLWGGSVRDFSFFISFSIFFFNFPTGMLLKLNPPLCCWVHLLANQMDPASLFFPKL